jgi:hypothetical protein
MKRILLALPASLVLFACTDDDHDLYDETARSTPVDERPVVTDPTVANAETRFEALSAKANRLVEVATRSADAADDLDDLVAELDDEREDAIQRLDVLRDASSDSLASAGDAFEDALDELEAAIDRLDRRLREEA